MHVDLFACTHKVWLYKDHKMQVFPGRTRKEVDGKWDQGREREKIYGWIMLGIAIGGETTQMLT